MELTNELTKVEKRMFQSDCLLHISTLASAIKNISLLTPRSTELRIFVTVITAIIVSVTHEVMIDAATVASGTHSVMITAHYNTHNGNNKKISIEGTHGVRTHAIVLYPNPNPNLDL